MLGAVNAGGMRDPHLLRTLVHLLYPLPQLLRRAPRLCRSFGCSRSCHAPAAAGCSGQRHRARAGCARELAARGGQAYGTDPTKAASSHECARWSPQEDHSRCVSGGQVKQITHHPRTVGWTSGSCSRMQMNRYHDPNALVQCNEEAESGGQTALPLGVDPTPRRANSHAPRASPLLVRRPQHEASPPGANDRASNTYINSSSHISVWLRWREPASAAHCTGRAYSTF